MIMVMMMSNARGSTQVHTPALNTSNSPSGGGFARQRIVSRGRVHPWQGPLALRLVGTGLMELSLLHNNHHPSKKLRLRVDLFTTTTRQDSLGVSYYSKPGIAGRVARKPHARVRSRGTHRGHHRHRPHAHCGPQNVSNCTHAKPPPHPHPSPGALYPPPTRVRLRSRAQHTKPEIPVPPA